MKKVLCWSDAAVAGTGFGVVSKYVLTALHNTGKYKIDHLAINFHGDFVDREEIPWQMQPAKLLDPKDPHGMKMFFRTLMKKKYDIVWILNDLYVTTKVTDFVNKAREKYIMGGEEPPIFVYYYPVDCHVQPDSAGMLDTADKLICYTDHGKEETLKIKPSVEDKLIQIPHGVDTSVFRPMSTSDIASAKWRYFNVKPDTFMVVQVNRNSTRKQIPYSMLAFKEFQKKVPNSKMYIHTMLRDQGADLTKTMEDLGLDPVKDIVFPAKYSPAQPAPDHILNMLYNCGDLFLTTHLGEGWGLTVTEAMAAGVPVVAPNNTSMPQQLGEDSERGYMYECKDMCWIDSSGFRPKGLIPDIVDKMMEVYNAGPKQKNPVVEKAREYALQHDWTEVTKAWVELFDSLKKGDSRNKVITQEV